MSIEIKSYFSDWKEVDKETAITYILSLVRQGSSSGVTLDTAIKRVKGISKDEIEKRLR